MSPKNSEFLLRDRSRDSGFERQVAVSSEFSISGSLLAATPRDFYVSFTITLKILQISKNIANLSVSRLFGLRDIIYDEKCKDK